MLNCPNFILKLHSKREEKFKELRECPSFKNIHFEKIHPKKSFWLDYGRTEWEDFIALRSNKDKREGIFILGELGQTTGRNSWVYDYNKERLSKNIKNFIECYNADLEHWKEINATTNINIKKKKPIEDFITSDLSKIKWDRELKNVFKRGIALEFDESCIRKAFRKPFLRTFLYYSNELITNKYRGFEAFPQDSANNISIMTTDKNFGDFSCLISDSLVGANLLQLTRHFPLYRYNYERASMYKEMNKTGRLDNITDWALEKFSLNYEKTSITKKQIFYYVYAILNSQEYRELYKNDLFKENAKVPLLKSYDDFLLCSQKGEELAKLHLAFEKHKAHKELVITKNAMFKIPDEKLYRMNKMKLSKDKSSLSYNEYLTISNIPKEAYEWRINGNSAIEELISKCVVKTDKDTKLTKDPNSYKGSKYIYELCLSIITMSIETAKLRKEIPALEGNIITKAK